MNVLITFLGTSNAIPTAQRSHPSILLEWENEHILFDCGEGTQRQFKIAKLNPCKLTRIFLTHLHGDHSFGLPGIMKTLEMSEYSKTLNIYGPRGTERHLTLLQQLYGRFNISYRVKEIDNELIINEKHWSIGSQQMNHTIPTLAYAFMIKEKNKINKKKLAKLKLPNSPLIGQLQNGRDIIFNNKKILAKDLTYTQKGKKIAIILDTKINDNAYKIAKNADLLICESTYAESEASYAENYKHLTAKQASTIAKKARVKSLVLTHIAQRYEHNLKKIELEAKKVFKNTKLVKDFSKIII